MIRTAAEFVELCESHDPEDINKTLSESAVFEIWVEIVESYPERRIDVAQNRTIPQEIILILASCGDETVRSLIAQKRKLPVDLFSKLAEDPEETVRRKIAANQKTPLEVLQNLTSDPIESVASVAQYNLRERSRR